MNESIDRMRHSATRSLLERDDVIIVASVSCLYGIGSVETYSAMIFDLKKGQTVDQREIVRKLVALQYKRNDAAFQRGNFRVKGDTLEIFPSHYEDTAWRVSFFGDDIEEIVEFDPLTGKKVASLNYVRVFANSHYVTPGPTLKQAMEAIKFELAERLKELVTEGKLLEAQRLEQRTNFDLEMIAATGSCAGIENYSRFLTGRMPGEPPPTLFEYLPENALLFVDESHQTIGQINGMSRGDHRRKITLAEYGFRLPVGDRQPPAALQRMGRDAPADDLCLGDAGRVGDGADRRRVRRTGDPPDRADRSAGRDQAGRGAGAGPDRRMPQDRGAGLSHAGHDADQADGGGSDRVHARGGARRSATCTPTSRRWSGSS